LRCAPRAPPTFILQEGVVGDFWVIVGWAAVVVGIGVAATIAKDWIGRRGGD
jgi:hypothetical protein